MSRGKKPVYDRQEIFRLHSEGLNNSKIAEKIGCSNQTVYNVLKSGRSSKKPKDKDTHITKKIAGRVYLPVWLTYEVEHALLRASAKEQHRTKGLMSASTYVTQLIERHLGFRD